MLAQMPKSPRFPPNAVAAAHAPRIVEVLAFPSVQLLDVTGPLQAFATANDQITQAGGAAPYDLRVVAKGGQGVTASAGLAITAAPLPRPSSAVDTLLIAGGPGVEAAAADPLLVDWVRQRAARARRVASVCTGAFLLAAVSGCAETQKGPQFHVVVMAETGGIHAPYVVAAKKWLNQLAADDNFTVDYIVNSDPINDEFLSHYQVFIQLNFPPYAWRPSAVEAFKRYITEGKGGWIGFHHASLIGEFDGYPMWRWYSQFMGGIRWTAYIPTFAAATVRVEDRDHPIMRGVPASFFIAKEEWYTYDKSPRPNVHVIASVDESTYAPDSKVKMGDHPVIWSNDHVKARNVYIFMGHSPILFDSPEYKLIFRNAIFWAAGKLN